MKKVSAPVRTCVGCGARDAQSRLVRLQLDAAANLRAVDRAHAGRSAYVHADPKCVEGLIKSRSLRRSLRGDVERSARQRCVEQIRAAGAMSTKQVEEGAGCS